MRYELSEWEKKVIGVRLIIKNARENHGMMEKESARTIAGGFSEE